MVKDETELGLGFGAAVAVCVGICVGIVHGQLKRPPLDGQGAEVDVVVGGVDEGAAVGIGIGAAVWLIAEGDEGARRIVSALISRDGDEVLKVMLEAAAAI